MKTEIDFLVKEAEELWKDLHEGEELPDEDTLVTWYLDITNQWQDAGRYS